MVLPRVPKGRGRRKNYVRALVAGAGIGGLAAAIAIRQAGHGVAVFEQAERLEELGAGLAVSANARKALAMLGLHERVAARGADGTRLVLRSSDGTLLSEFSLDPGDASLGIHRADLQEELIHALGAEHVRLAARCTGCEEHADGVTLHIADASPEHGDFLIGADGIRSVIRADLYGEERLR